MTVATAISKRAAIIEALLARLREIGPQRGYATDAGLRVHFGPIAPGPDEAYPLITLTPAEDTDGFDQEVEDRYEVREVWAAEALTTVTDPAQPLVDVEPLRADLKRALFRPHDPDLGGLLSRPIGHVGEGTRYREPGSHIVGCALRVSTQWIEGYGTP